MSRKNACTPYDDGVTDGFSDGHTEDGDDDIGTCQTQNDGDSTTDDGQKSKESHPWATARHEPLGTIERLLTHVEVAL